MSKKAFFGGFGLGFLFREWRSTLVVLVFLWFAGNAAWDMLPGFVQWLIGVALIALVALWVAYRMGRVPWAAPRRRSKARYAGEADPVPTGLHWVYVITEWRTRDDAWLDRDRCDASGRHHPDAVKHLVYIGMTNSPTHRMLQHAETKHWWHRQLMFEFVQCQSRAEALRLEERWIDAASKKRPLSERPRENYEHNPSYDRARCELMHRRRLATMPQEIAA